LGKWDWQVFLQDTGGGRTYLEWLMSAWGWTLSVSVLSLIVALVVGSLMGILRTTPNKWLVLIGECWTELFRNVPLLVQIFLWYHVIPSIFLVLRNVPSLVLVVFALGFFTSARIAEQVKAGIQAMPRGQALAASAIGLSVPQAYRYVLLPQALRIILPPLSSDFLNTIKNTSVALTIGLMELTARTRAIESYTSQVFEAFAAASVIYIVVNVTVVQAMGWLERRLSVPGMIGSSSGSAGAGH